MAVDAYTISSHSSGKVRCPVPKCYSSTVNCLLYATKFRSREVDSSQFVIVDEVYSSVAVQ